MTVFNNIRKFLFVMRITKYMLLLFSILTIGLNSVFAQSSNITKAVTELQAGNLDSSKAYIELACANEETNKDPKTWYYRGFIYKKIYSQIETDNKLSPARDESINSFKTFFELDTVSELHESAYKTVKYLSSTIYNDAAGLLNEHKYDYAVSNFDKYKAAMNIIEKDYNVKPLEVQFYLVLGQQYNQLYESNRKENEAYFDKTKDVYLYVIDLDSNNTSANYNLALLYYNDAVDIIKNLDYDLDLITLELIQDDVIQLFKKSQPYMEKALSLDICRKETYIGLSGIYFSLNKMERSKLVQDQLDFLKTPYSIEMYEGTFTDGDAINYIPMCFEEEKPYYAKSIKDKDGKYKRVDNNRYIFKSGQYIQVN